MYDVVVIGGGAAGLFAAGIAGQRGKKTLLIEHREKVGKKILISGGGRCNFTNLEVSAKNYVSQNEHFCRSALSRYSPQDFIALVQRYGIAFHEKTLGQLFCDDSARQIVAMLVEECNKGGVTIATSCSVSDVAHDREFVLSTSQGEIRSTALVIATGGLSIPKMGATGFGYDVAKKFGIDVTATTPALVSFTTKPFGDLAGVAAPARVNLGKVRFEESVLFTHQGLSGPAILQISSYWRPGEAITIDWSPSVSIFDALKKRKSDGENLQLHNALADLLPRRLALHFAEPVALQEQSDDKLRALADAVHRFTVTPTGTTGYEKAEVTRGGVSTDELSQKTLEAKKRPGLYFIGEVVDVTGWLGGYNFQWAWASGFACGQAV